MTDLETAARERALAMHLASIVGMYFPREVETHFNSGFLAGAAHMQKRIEELENDKVRDQRMYDNLNSVRIEELNDWEKWREDILKTLTKERQISKMLEEGLKDAISEPGVVKNRTFICERTLSEVQKLRET
jgi:hypothetical protein